MISIGQLEKSVNIFADKLRKQGHEVDVKAFRSGTMTGCDTQGVSNVELRVNGQSVRFMANAPSVWGCAESVFRPISWVQGP